MIPRLLKTAMTLFVCFCVGTLLAQAIILGYLWVSWKMDREKIIQMLAIAQGVDLFAAQKDDQSDLEAIPPEEPSYQDWLQRRATMFRDLELREQALENALARLSFEQQKLAADWKAKERLQQDFEARLLALKQGAEAEGRQAVGRILESIKPKQAKEQVLQMLENDEINEVVILLSAMAEIKLAKLLAEFKTPEEAEKIGEVLRLIRQGEPISSMTSQTLRQPQTGNLTGT